MFDTGVWVLEDIKELEIKTLNLKRYDFWFIFYNCMFILCCVCLLFVCQSHHSSFNFIVSTDTSKGKAIPLQAWTGPEGSRRLRLPDFKTIST